MRDPNVARSEGCGVYIETYGPICKLEEAVLREVANKFGGKECTELDNIYQYNFVTFEFASYKEAKQVVRECKKLLSEGEYLTVNIDDMCIDHL